MRCNLLVRIPWDRSGLKSAIIVSFSLRIGLLAIIVDSLSTVEYLCCCGGFHLFIMQLDLGHGPGSTMTFFPCIIYMFESVDVTDALVWCACLDLCDCM